MTGTPNINQLLSLHNWERVIGTPVEHPFDNSFMIVTGVLHQTQTVDITHGLYNLVALFSVWIKSTPPRYSIKKQPN
ncbi:MAG: hypothetical protein HFP77_07170 [Methylococcales symbiont of Iophon sp. n. MRB-2018]|nr:MAG: hypothetical protein HFP77_07170 [Methylococcales symbiont of Iophon sp. n. MRB-2018]KAF3979617.1 MAG: hypothetical protein HFP76_06240 [Methylococcales symbiont of Iophon sp. n. MRB-2018]